MSLPSILCSYYSPPTSSQGYGLPVGGLDSYGGFLCLCSITCAFAVSKHGCMWRLITLTLMMLAIWTAGDITCVIHPKAACDPAQGLTQDQLHTPLCLSLDMLVGTCIFLEVTVQGTKDPPLKAWQIG